MLLPNILTLPHYNIPEITSKAKILKTWKKAKIFYPLIRLGQKPATISHPTEVKTGKAIPVTGREGP
jgi:hypothetical protein